MSDARGVIVSEWKLLNELTKQWKKTSKKLLLAPALSTYTPESFIEYVKSLYNAAASKGSKSVDGVTLTLGKRIIVRIKRDPKALSRDEVERLSTEHEVEPTELLKILISRKVGITYGETDERKESESSLFIKTKKERKPRTKKTKEVASSTDIPESSDDTAQAVGE